MAGPSLETIEWLAEIATLAVVFGLGFEYFPSLIEYFKTPWYLRSRINIIKFLHIIVPIFVVGGVACELIFHHLSTGMQNAQGIEQQRTIEKLRTANRNLEQRIAPRVIDRQKFGEILKDDPKGIVEILYG